MLLEFFIFIGFAVIVKIFSFKKEFDGVLVGNVLGKGNDQNDVNALGSIDGRRF